MIDIFSQYEDSPLFVECDCPTTLCNYRCPYCFLPNNVGGYLPFEIEFNKWKDTILTIVSKIKRPIILSMGPSGEPMVQNKWWDCFYSIINKPNVKMLTFVTNLSLPIKDKLKEIDFGKLGITATLHPTQFKNEKDEFKSFFNQILYLKKNGVKVAVNYVLIPYQIDKYPKYSAIFKEHDIYMTANLFRGIWNDKNYPESYTEFEINKIRHFLNKIPFIVDYQSYKKSPYGKKCTAGRYALNIDYSGNVFPCYYMANSMGTVYNDSLKIYDENIICQSKICECKWTIPLQEDISKQYYCIGNVHEIYKRNDLNSISHPFIKS